jgi:hypothetical protein
MKKHIAEELPARKHAPAAAAPAGGEKKESGGKSPEKRVKQAIYDIRYRARREELPIRQAYSQYMQNSNMSQQEKTLVKQKLFGKGGMQAEDFNIEEFASNNVADALYKVFVEGVKTEEPIVLTYMEKFETAEHRKYKVRVTDKNGRSYVRYATRDKISSLRSNPNIESVEMTGYGEPYEGEKNKGEQTAAAKAGKDYDGDGKIESGAKEYRGAVHNAIQRKKGGKPDGQDTSSVKEEFLGEVSDEKLNPDSNSGKQIKPMGKGKTNTVVINPELPGSERTARSSFQLAHHEMDGPYIAEKALSRAQQKFMGMVYAAKKGETPASPEVAKAAAGMSKKEAKKFAKTKHKGLPGHVKEESECGMDEKPKLKKSEGGVEDPREIPTKVNMVKNKLRSMGLKMSYEPEGEVIDERRAEDRGKQRPERNRAMEIMRTMPNYRQGGMTRSGGTIASHEEGRGVKKKRTGPVEPQKPAVTPADKLARRKAQQAAAKKAAQDMYQPREGESD